MEKIKVKELKNVVVRFSGDSGDGMQLTGTMFSNVAAILGNEISTFPDFPSEIRAPQGTVSGVSGFQVHLGISNVNTPGDLVDVLVAMNPAALKVNKDTIKKGALVIIDEDTFNKSGYAKATFETEDPFKELAISESVQIISAPLSTLTKKSLEDFGLDLKSVLRSKNMFALGLILWLFNRPIDNAIALLERKFGKKKNLLDANIKVLTDGFNYGNNLHLATSTYHVEKSTDTAPGRYTSINGNTATAFGLIAATEKAGLPLFLGSYPITPASDIMHVLALRRDMGVKVVQAEDEIAGVTMAIGAAFAGNLAATNTSGPGLALKTEGIGLAVMAELPLVIIDVMRSGPSTGMPTKTEQTDLLQAFYGRNGESPLAIVAPATPDECFALTYSASKIALEHSTPIIVLTDSFLGNGTSLWRLPKIADLEEIKPNYTPENMKGSAVTARNEETKARYWSVPGREGYEHRNGGLEKDYTTGNISSDPMNHEKMVAIRAEKVKNIATVIPQQELLGDTDADILLVGWGSTKGHLMGAMDTINSEGKHKVALAHFKYLNPLPTNTEELLEKFDKIVVCELNSGHFASILRATYPSIDVKQYNKVQGQPFRVNELVEHIETILS